MTSKMAGRQHVLLAEDDPLDIEFTLEAFAQNNFPHEITVVNDGEQALDYLYRREKFKTRPDWHPVFVLLDNHMPKVTGLDVVKIIKADDNLSSIPIVALTSSHDAPDLKEFFTHGVNAYVVKPVQFSELVKVIKQIGIFWTEINASQEKTR